VKALTRLRRTAVAWVAKQLSLAPVDDSRGWFTLFRSHDRETGSWQQDQELSRDTVIAYAPVYSCATLIASDIGKVLLRLMQLEEGVWVETSSPSFSPVLKRPNHFQTRQQFIESWVISKLLHGNAYILKIRDDRRVVKAMYVLDPTRVTPLVAPDGSVFYELRRDDLSKLPQEDYPAVPAAEIIHDRMECLFHPLVGISPLWAAHLASSQGLRIQKNSERFFRNMSRPGGMLTAPNEISDETAARLKATFEGNFSGEKLGRLFVGGDGLSFNPLAIPADESQLVEQLKLSAEQVAATFHVPAFLIGAAAVPSYDNVQALNQQYHTQCLQKLFTAIEDLLDDGLGLTTNKTSYRCEFDLDDLLRMDSKTMAETEGILVQRGISSPNESRRKFGKKPVKGGETPYLQQQNYSLGALAERDTGADPFRTAPPPAPAAVDEADEADKALHLLFRKSPEGLIHV
jgi:HK97 family phage portal protein